MLLSPEGQTLHLRDPHVYAFKSVRLQPVCCSSAVCVWTQQQMSLDTWDTASILESLQQHAPLLTAITVLAATYIFVKRIQQTGQCPFAGRPAAGKAAAPSKGSAGQVCLGVGGLGKGSRSSVSCMLCLCFDCGIAWLHHSTLWSAAACCVLQVGEGHKGGGGWSVMQRT